MPLLGVVEVVSAYTYYTGLFISVFLISLREIRGLVYQRVPINNVAEVCLDFIEKIFVVLDFVCCSCFLLIVSSGYSQYLKFNSM